MPGEATGAADGPYLSYLRASAAWDRRFPASGTTPTGSRYERVPTTSSASRGEPRASPEAHRRFRATTEVSRAWL
jgi:hypothetical protein